MINYSIRKIDFHHSIHRMSLPAEWRINGWSIKRLGSDLNINPELIRHRVTFFVQILLIDI